MQIFSMTDKEKVSTVSTNSSGVRALSLSQDGESLAVIDVNGALALHAMSSVSMQTLRRELFQGALISKNLARDTTQKGCKMAWLQSTSRKHLFVPATKGAIAVFTQGHNSQSWQEEALLHDPSSSLSHGQRDVHLVVLSPNGKFLASVDVSGHVVVWKIDRANPHKSVPIKALDTFQDATAPLLDLQWGLLPEDNYLLGLGLTWSKVDEVVPAEEGHPVTPSNEDADTAVDNTLTDEALMELMDATEAVNKEESNKVSEAAVEEVVKAPLSASKAATVSRKRLQQKAAANDDDDDDDALFTAASPVAPAVSNGKSARISTFSAEDAPANVRNKLLFDDEAQETTAKDLRKEDLLEEEEDDDDDQDDDSMVVDKIQGKGKKFSGDILEIARALQESGALAAAAAGPVKFQPAFQPSSTRPDEKHRRYLVWNSVGNITLREESLENRVEIRFTDASSGNRNEAFADRLGYVMGALGYDGAAFATSADEPSPETLGRDEADIDHIPKAVKGSTLFYHAFPGAQHLDGVNENFKVVLSDGEEIQALAVGAGYVVAATSKRLLRVFTSTGIEISVTSLPGPVVCLVALQETFAVIYHAALPMEETFVMHADVWKVHWRQGYLLRNLTQGVSVPLSRKANIEWVGFDVDTQSLLVLDSQGIMSGLFSSTGRFHWTPLFNIHAVRKTMDHRYWPIMVKHARLVYVLLNGESKPAIYPQPVVSTKGLRVQISTHRDGNDWNEAAKEKMHGLLWEKLKVDHLQQSLTTLQQLGSGALQSAFLEDMSRIEEEVRAQQSQSDKVTLKAFQDACQMQQLPMALSLAVRLQETKAIAAGIKIANHFGRVTVAEALDTMLQHREALEAYQAQMLQAAEPGYSQYDVASSGHYQEENQNFASQSVDPAGSSASGGILSRKASLKQQQQQDFASAGLSKKVIVSPDADQHTNNASKSLNPFAKTGMTPQKKRTADSMLEGLDLQKSSPSPKKPTLNVSASFFNHVLRRL